MLSFDPRYIQMTLNLWHGAVTLTVYSPEDALWISDQINQLTDDLRVVHSGIIHVNQKEFIVLEREIDQDETHFAVQCFRSETSCDVDGPPQLEVLVHAPLINL